MVLAAADRATELYESAGDGANFWDEVRHVMLRDPPVRSDHAAAFDLG